MFGKKMKWSSGLIFLLLTTFLLVALSSVTFAANGDSTGNESGIMKPLGLMSVTLADGTKVNDGANIPIKPKFTFLFDKNVVYLLYWERNKNCFHLYDENNEELALNVTKIDDTVDFSKRQYIWAEPVDALSSGTNYRIFVAPDLLAKNGGSTLGMTTNNQGATIKFKTTGERKSNNSGNAAPTGDSPTVAAVINSQDQPAAANSTNQTTVASNTSSTTESVTSSKIGTETQATPKTNVNQTSGAGSGSGTVSNQQTNPESGSSSNDQAKVVADVLKHADTTQAAMPVESSQRKVANYVAAIGIASIVVWLIIEYIRRKNKKN